MGFRSLRSAGRWPCANSASVRTRIKIFSFAFEPELLLGARHRLTVAGGRDGDMVDVPGEVRWPQWVRRRSRLHCRSRPPACVRSRVQRQSRRRPARRGCVPAHGLRRRCGRWSRRRHRARRAARRRPATERRLLPQTSLVRGRGHSCSQALLAKTPSQTAASGRNTRRDALRRRRQVRHRVGAAFRRRQALRFESGDNAVMQRLPPPASRSRRRAPAPAKSRGRYRKPTTSPAPASSASTSCAVRLS